MKLDLLPRLNFWIDTVFGGSIFAALILSAFVVAILSQFW